MIKDDDLTAWLGPAVNDLTPEQIELIIAASLDIDRRYPDPDEQDNRETALTATVQYLLGDLTPEQAGRALTDARRNERAAFVTALQVGVMAHRANGTPKATAAKLVGVDRMALLKALGERAPATTGRGTR